MPDLSEIVETALRLTAQDRAALAQTLLSSLDDLTPEESGALWAEEAGHRLSELRAGRAQTVSSNALAEKVAEILR
jgi:putative addiction module component (TIGR02574 family)